MATSSSSSSIHTLPLTVYLPKPMKSSSLFFPNSISTNNLFSPYLSPSFSSSFNKVDYILRVSSQGLPSELEEDSKFVPLSAEDPSYGPPALLLVGFRVEESDKIQQLLKDLDGEFLQIVYCTEDMITHSLWDAVNTKQQNLKNLKIAKSVPRICFLSGLTGEEMMMFIDAFHETGLESAVFAAHVPNSSSKSLQELIEEVIGDHEMMAKQRPDSA